LETIEEHAQFMWREKHLPAVSPLEKASDGKEVVDIGAQRRGTLEELEKAHIYIEQLNNRALSLEAENNNLEKRIEELETRLTVLETFMTESGQLQTESER
jgi:hypothetical protein